MVNAMWIGFQQLRDKLIKKKKKDQTLAFPNWDASAISANNGSTSNASSSSIELQSNCSFFDNNGRVGLSEEKAKKELRVAAGKGERKSTEKEMGD